MLDLLLFQYILLVFLFLFLFRIDPKGIKKNVNLFSGIQSNFQAKVALCNGYVFNNHLNSFSRDFIKMKKLTSMKNFFSMNGVHWPDLEWINTDSILQKTTLPEVPEGFYFLFSLMYR